MISAEMSEPVRLSSHDAVGETGPLGSSAERYLFQRVQAGGRSAVDALFERYSSWLRRWARGRLPQWVRGAIDTSDLVQDTLHQTFVRLDGFRSREASALRIYLRRAVENRIRDELRRAKRRGGTGGTGTPVRLSNDAAPQHQQLVDVETWKLYMDGLARLSPRDRRLIAGHAELGYNHHQLALVEGLPSPDAARMALRRAVIRLSEVIPNP